MESRELLSSVAGSQFVFIDTGSSDQLNAVCAVNLITLYVWVPLISVEKKEKDHFKFFHLMQVPN